MIPTKAPSKVAVEPSVDGVGGDEPPVEGNWRVITWTPY